MLNRLCTALIIITLNCLVAVYSLLPSFVRHAGLGLLLKLVYRLSSKFSFISERNLEIAFPEKSLEERRAIEAGMLKTLVELVDTALRLESFDEQWVSDNVALPRKDELARLKASSKIGCIFATAHLGPFELLAHSYALRKNPLSFVVRDLKSPIFENWLRRKREANGNIVISRRGAFNDVISDLSSGRDVGILFDQNVTRKSATFVPLFGKAAATSKLPALLAIKSSAPMLFTWIRKERDGRYTMVWEHIETHDILSLDVKRDEKVRRITMRLNAALEAAISSQPEAWFWMHRRWKTRPKGEPENWYDKDKSFA